MCLKLIKTPSFEKVLLSTNIEIEFPWYSNIIGIIIIRIIYLYVYIYIYIYIYMYMYIKIILILCT